MSPRSTRVSNQAMAMEFVGDAPFPVSKRELMRIARNNDAPEEVMAILEQVPDRHYDNPQDLSEAIRDHVKNNFRITAARNTGTMF
jgi:methionine salvage enolase-phosphatase E1